MQNQSVAKSKLCIKYCDFRQLVVFYLCGKP